MKVQTYYDGPTCVFGAVDTPNGRAIADEMLEGCEPTCLMLNYWTVCGKERFGYCEKFDLIQARKDYKYHGGNVFQVPDREVISAHDNIGTSALAVFLRDTFPKKCRFER